MGADREIQSLVRERYGKKPKTCWIAHCKEIVGLHLRQAHNRQGRERAVPCPADRQEHIIAAFRHFGLI